MQDTLVSARMPAARKDRAREVLDSLGATTSDLINSAFEYVIEAGQLPSASAAEQREQAGFAQFVDATTFGVSQLEGSGDYKELQKRLRLADYESLA